MRPVRVAVADDSSFVRKALVRILAADPRIQVVGTAATAEELLDNLETWAADVITLDLVMPGMGGLRALDHIRRIRPTPVVVLSSHAQRDAMLAIEALHRGAIDFIDKRNYSLVDFGALGEVLSEKILQFHGAEMPRPAPPSPQPPPLPPAPLATSPGPRLATRRAYDLLLIGASTGGPLAVQRVLGDLGPAVDIPILIVQHMPIGFTAPFAQRLDNHLSLPVREAVHREPLVPGTAYIAPAGVHLQVRRTDRGLESYLSQTPATSSHRPSVDELFRSAAHWVGRRAMAILLTGMGRDGAEGMAALAEAGAYTLTQDEATCVIFGMPRAAVELGAARETLPLAELGPRVRYLLNGARSTASSRR